MKISIETYQLNLIPSYINRNSCPQKIVGSQQLVYASEHNTVTNADIIFERFVMVKKKIILRKESDSNFVMLCCHISQPVFMNLYCTIEFSLYSL